MVDLFLGPNHDVEFIRNDPETHVCTPQEIATFIMQDEIVAVYNGRSEAGPRALGNRSILYDPRDNNTKETINKVKKREKFRPFAAAVMLEHANDWFDMGGLERSPTMSYCVDAREEVYYKIPGVLHVDHTCRVQTVEKNIPHLYEVIEEFYRYTKVPMVLNTSFNLAGDTMVETIDDAFRTIRNSDINYMYLPEINKLISVPYNLGKSTKPCYNL